MREFLFGDQQIMALIGWHVAIALVFIIGIYIGHLIHKPKRRR